jgi:hypothetical protein
MKSAVTFEDVRELALSLPEVEEGLFVGESPTFKVRGKGFARFGPPVSGLKPPEVFDTLVIRLPEGQREALLATDDRFFITPHYERGSAVLVRLSTLSRGDLDELRELLTDAWRRFAPKRLLAAFDGSHT